MSIQNFRMETKGYVIEAMNKQDVNVPEDIDDMVRDMINLAHDFREYRMKDNLNLLQVALELYKETGYLVEKYLPIDYYKVSSEMTLTVEKIVSQKLTPARASRFHRMCVCICTSID